MFQFSSQSWSIRSITMALCALIALAVGVPRGADAGGYEKPNRIKPEQIELRDMSLKFGLEMWHVRGNIINHSPHDLQGIILMVRIRDCGDTYRCIVVGEQFVTIAGLKMPPFQKRAFSKPLIFPNRAKARKPQHEFVIVRTFEDYSELEYYQKKRIQPFDLSEW